MASGKVFSEQEIKFIAANIIQALEYIHSKGVIHRDLKPENLVFDKRGYLRLTDFGISAFLGGDNSNINSGTAGYIAPEVLCRQPHDQAVDYYALGSLLFELVQGFRPYPGLTRKEVRQNILSYQAQLDPNELENQLFSEQGVDFINQLLERNPNMRLGSQRGSFEIKRHPWFAFFPWQELERKKVRPVFKPKRSSQKNNSFLEKGSPQELAQLRRSHFVEKGSLGSPAVLKSSHQPFRDYFFNTKENQNCPPRQQKPFRKRFLSNDHIPRESKDYSSLRADREQWPSGPSEMLPSLVKL